MQKIYNIKKGNIEISEKIDKNYWIDLIGPKDSLIEEISTKEHINKNDILKTLDKSEIPHTEIDESYTLFIVNIPYFSNKNNKKKYRSHPFGIFLKNNGFITVSLENHPIREDIKKFVTEEKDYLNKKVLPIFLIGKSAEYFLKYLNEIQNDIIKMEKTLISSTSNKDLESMLELQKSLLYFTTSLQGNRTILEKMENNEVLSKEELDLLKDVQIEVRQAIEMTNIYREILENTMDTYSSIISNNMNDIMKFLTSITLVISIPTMISSFLGMNIFFGDFGTNPYSFILIILLSIFVTIILIIVLKKKNLL